MRGRPLNFQIARQTENGALVIRLEGELDLGEVEWVQEELVEAERSDAERIVLDLSGLTFIDSSGIALLVAAAQRSSQDDDRLRIKRASSREVKRMLTLTGIADRLPFLD